MQFKKWFEQRAKLSAKGELNVDDLIVLRRFDQAEKALKEKLHKKPADPISRVKLAEVYQQTGRRKEAVGEYQLASDLHFADGFYDKAIAVLAKAVKLSPQNPELKARMQRLGKVRRHEQRLSSVLRALSRAEGQVGHATTSSYLELRRIWGELSTSPLIDRLNDSQLGHLLKNMELVKIHKQKILVEKGQTREELYLVTRGKLEVIFELPNGEITVLRSMEPGDVIGERALLEHEPWCATYRCAVNSVLLKLDRTALEAALHGNPDPRGLLDALRQQGLDAEVVSTIERTLAS